MEGDLMSRIWSARNFADAPLGDERRSQRLVTLVERIRANPQDSLPKQCADEAELAGAYRLLSNPAVDPQAIQRPHRMITAQRCALEPVTLCVQDTTELNFSRRAARGSITGVGPLGSCDGGGQGLLQHAALAVSTVGAVLGVLDQQWHCQHRPAPGETRRQRQQRETEADVWAKAARAVAALDTGDTRLIHVGDRHSDVFGFMNQARALGHGWIVRAMHNRYVGAGDGHVNDARDASDAREASDARHASDANAACDAHDAHEAHAGDEAVMRLQERLAAQPAMACRVLPVTRRAGSAKTKRIARLAKLEVRFVAVTLPPPRNDPRFKGVEPIRAWAVQLKEIDGTTDDPILWTLLTDEPVLNAEDALRVADWYGHRWVIEEWHRVLKEGCRIESAQFDHAADIERLGAILGPVAADLLRVRDLADDQATADDPAALRDAVSPTMILVVAKLRKTKPQTLTPRAFWQTIARRGGWLGRKNDPRPGWRALWKGWQPIRQMAAGYDLAMSGADV